MFAISKAADLNQLVQGGHLYWAFPFSNSSLLSEPKIFIFNQKVSFNIVLTRFPFRERALPHLARLRTDVQAFEVRGGLLVAFRPRRRNRRTRTRVRARVRAWKSIFRLRNIFRRPLDSGRLGGRVVIVLRPMLWNFLQLQVTDYRNKLERLSLSSPSSLVYCLWARSGAYLSEGAFRCCTLG